jgi:hypothetical protein
MVGSSSCERKTWQGKMDHSRDCIAEKGMPKPRPGGWVTTRKMKL